jgi:hypothetical protein
MTELKKDAAEPSPEQLEALHEQVNAMLETPLPAESEAWPLPADAAIPPGAAAETLPPPTPAV